MSEQTPEHTLPRLVEARKLVAVEARFKRKVAAADLVRLGESSISIDDVEVDVRFGRDEQGRPTLSGELTANIALQCQRCLEPMPFSASKNVRLALVWDEAQGKALPKDLEPWIVGEGEADLIEIVEEEILLLLPVVARHDHDCLDLSALDQGVAPEQTSDKQNPFSVLADLNLKK